MDRRYYDDSETMNMYVIMTMDMDTVMVTVIDSGHGHGRDTAKEIYKDTNTDINSQSVSIVLA
jgi:hypothetical protein